MGHHNLFLGQLRSVGHNTEHRHEQVYACTDLQFNWNADQSDLSFVNKIIRFSNKLSFVIRII